VDFVPALPLSREKKKMKHHPKLKLWHGPLQPQYALSTTFRFKLCGNISPGNESVDREGTQEMIVMPLYEASRKNKSTVSPMHLVLGKYPYFHCTNFFCYKSTDDSLPAGWHDPQENFKIISRLVSALLPGSHNRMLTFIKPWNGGVPRLSSQLGLELKVLF
jgi:hypothetical protein